MVNSSTCADELRADKVQENGSSCGFVVTGVLWGQSESLTIELGGRGGVREGLCIGNVTAVCDRLESLQILCSVPMT
jgi:hypothetical protein